MTELEPAVAVTSAEGSPAMTAASSTMPVVVVQFPDIWGRNISPFGLKLEAWLRLADIPYTIQPSTNVARAPKGKLPYIRDEGRLIGDTSLIIEHLKATRGIDPDAGLKPRQRAEALALQRLLEEHLYFAIIYSRWLDEAGWSTLVPAFFGHLPAPVRQLAADHYRRRFRRMLQLQGLGRHRPSEIYAMAHEDLAAVAEYLGDQPFMMGEQLTTIDAVAYGFIANILYVPFETELKQIAQGYPSLITYCEAMEQGLRAED